MSLLSFLASVLASVPGQQPQSPDLSGRIHGSLPAEAVTMVRAYSLRHDGEGRIQRLSKHDFFHAPLAEVKAKGDSFEFDRLPRGAYCIVAFQDLNGDGQLDYRPGEPLGWYAAQPGGLLDPVAIGDKPQEIEIRLRRITPFGVRSQTYQPLVGIHGELLQIQGIATLRLWGDAKQRGRAHGALVGKQILEFFEFYVIEDKFKSAELYKTTFARFLESHFVYPKNYLEEIEAVLKGMKDSGIDMWVPSLGRDFGRIDLLAINAYIETRAMRSSCTQFAAWGKQTEGTDVQGGTIAGRNMDGEIDIRKTTVSHFLAIAVDQQSRTHKRYVSMMWPGFVGTITGVNEDGFYAMENAGGTGPGPVVDKLVPISWTQRQTLELCGAASTPTQVRKILEAQPSSGGGSCGPGCIILFAQPYRGQAAPAFVYEGDRFGGGMRLPGEVRPKGPEHIMASNHHRKYGVSDEAPGRYFGKKASFSSQWRYEAGMHLLESWQRAGTKVGSAQMKRLLQTVAHGTTEHSIIFQPNQMLLHIAVDDLAADMWDAPYKPFKTIPFAEFFTH